MNAAWFVLTLVSSPVVAAVASLQQEEAEILKGELQGSELWFVETLDKLREENNRRRLEDHFTQFRLPAEGAFVRIESLYVDRVADLDSAWLSRLDYLAKWLDDVQKTKHWTRRVDFIVALKDPKDRADRQAALREMNSAWQAHGLMAKGSVDRTRLPPLTASLERARVIFERINDTENLAFTHLLQAIIASNQANDQLEYEQIVLAKDHWLKSGLGVDSDQYRWMLEQLRELQKRGVGAAPEPEPAAPPPADGAKEADKEKEKPQEPVNDDWQKTPTRIISDAKVVKLKTLAFAEEDPRTWPSFEIRGDASKTDVSRAIPDPFKPLGRPVEMIRNGDGYRIDLYGDKKTAERLQLGPGKIVNLTMRREQKDLGSTPYYFQLSLGDNEMLFGQSVQNGPNKDRAIVRYRTSCRLEGQFQGKKWTLVDDNDSGQFGDVVLRSDDYANDQRFGMPDSLFIGGLERPIPFTEYMLDGDNIYRLRIDPATYALESQTAASGKGWIVLDWGAGPVKPECLIVVGLDDRRNCAYDLTAQAKTPVVSGRYRLAYGILSVGKGDKAQRCLILPGKSEAIDVADGLEKPLQLGAPFAIDFSIRSEKDEVLVVGSSVRVQGRGREVYTRFSEILMPQVSARTKESNKVLERNKGMSRPDQEDFRNNPPAVAFPKSFRVKKDGKEIIQFQLSLRAHPLLGNAESTWR